MTPAEQAAVQAGKMLDLAAEHLLEPEYVANCVAVADAWTRLHLALTTGAIMRFSPD
ncbi:hypothetical protein [Nonomuraea wenchangensis]|uniref:Uncharacterized protein n=1 Tax=Nonomuraea wenchangensis TaxID=568860 RepID=A0A1I0LW86_9ACTN|nr:hypothetical protein [Nonomuraea wenchangensis]SEU46496.1 hypothetical protein SAMN05421811_12753 [Nonomuraea wenchangensis]